MLDGMGSLPAWAVLQRRGEVLAARFAERQDNAAEVARFRERAPQITSVEELLRDRRTLFFVLEAFQLESEVDKRAVLRRLFTEDPADPRSFANRMVDRRYRELNAAFGGRSGPPLRDAALVERIVREALANRFEKAAGEGNPGLREALYFRRMAAGITDVNRLMADRALTAVVRGALGLPKEFGLLAFEQQKRILEQRVPFAELRDPQAVARLVQRYLSALPAAEGVARDPRLALLAPGGSGPVGLLALVGSGLSLRA
jgi:hypothetical protein